MRKSLLTFRAMSSIHAGTGQTIGTIDLPIMREGHTGWPVIFGSAVKGALRAKAEEIEAKASWIREIFGDDDTGGSKFAGALSVSDAKILALPVRSLNRHFWYVTCPAVLRRLKDDLLFIGLSKDFTVDSVTDDSALLSVAATQVFLEDLQLTGKQSDLNKVTQFIAEMYPELTANELQKSLLVVSDNIFTYLARYTTEVNAHIAINPENKIVKDGALWYEESLPSHTLLYSVILAKGSRKGKDKDAAAIEQEFMSRLFGSSPYIQMGGNETTGMGWCKVQQVKGGAA